MRQAEILNREGDKERLGAELLYKGNEFGYWVWGALVCKDDVVQIAEESPGPYY
jgi:hypothetical protein